MRNTLFGDIPGRLYRLTLYLDCRGTCASCRTSAGRETGRAVLGGRDGVHGYATEAEHSG